LQKSLKGASIKYVHIDALGGYRGGYEKYMCTSEWQNAFKNLQTIATRYTTAIMCAEKYPWYCHRRYISNALSTAGWTVKHIIDGLIKSNSIID
jgi:uncharacterized protein (DUF488 family)